MFKILLASLYMSSLCSLTRSHSFANFVNNYNKRYDSTAEYFKRKSIFERNHLLIESHNRANRNWKLRMNTFGDLNWGEFRDKYVGVNTQPKFPRISSYSISENYGDLPKSWDWVSEGAVTPVKNQGRCGSCWAFSTTGALEGLNYIKNKQLTNFSEQELVDCSGSYGNNGCNGGLMDLAFKFVENQGICTEESYPYTGTDGQTCTKCNSVFKITGFQDVPKSDEKELQKAVYTQPVSVAIEADQPSFQFYHSGVFDGACGTNLDHGVLAVGYGTLNNTDYWKVKNSWGESWGNEGYILLARNIPESHGQCGIALQPSVPTLD